MGLQNKITYEYLKQTIGCEKVFKYYFGDFSLGESYHSPLRKDSKKSVGFFVNNNGSIVYNDFAEDRKYDFVNFVAKKLNISYHDAINNIFNTFKSILNNSNVQANGYSKPAKKKPKSVFKVVTKPFTKQDLQWWSQFSINKQELIENNVFSVASYSINNYTIYTQLEELRFAYLLKDEKGNAYFKIYTPLDVDKKWIFNGYLDMVYGLNKLNCDYTKGKLETLIITKSIKDYVVLKKFFPEVIALQNESRSSLNKYTIKALQKCYKNIYIWFDLDRPGIRAANYYKKKYGFIPIFICDNKLNIWKNLQKFKETKDPSDFVKKYNIFNFKKLINLNKNSL